MSNRRHAALLASLASLTLCAGAARADALVVGGGWDPFFWINATNPDGSTSPDGGPFLDASFTPEAFTFTLTATSDFKIVDSYYPGDQFDVVINGVDEGLTSTPIFDGLDAVTDFDADFADPSFSKANFSLAPGVYTVTGDVVQSPYGLGQGAVELSVPEPAAWAMMLLGFGAIGGLARRRKTEVSAVAG